MCSPRAEVCVGITLACSACAVFAMSSTGRVGRAASPMHYPNATIAQKRAAHRPRNNKTGYNFLKPGGGAPPPGSLKPDDIWAPRGSATFRTPHSGRIPRSAYEHVWAMPDDWLREVLGFTGSNTTNRFLINLGAHYEPNDVVALAQALGDARGCAIDSDDQMSYAAPGVRTHVGMMTVSNIARLLDECDTPQEPLLLKVDIDSIDVDVTLSVLRGRSPTFIFVELNEKVPPPVCYCNRYNPTRDWARLGGHHYGCSITGYVNALGPQGYRLVSVIQSDALFVHERAAAAVAEKLPSGRLPTMKHAYDVGYAKLQGRPQRYPWNQNVDHWLNETRPLGERAEEMRTFFARGIAARFADFAVESTSWPCNGSWAQ